MPVRLDFSKLSLKDALDLAILVEVEAFKRYKSFVEQLGHRAPGDPASVFAKMAENESKHGEQLAERRKAMFGDEPMKVTLDDLFDVEAPDVGKPRRTMSTRQAFEVAVSSEQKAYDFYDEALNHISDSNVRKLFSELRDEETEHVRQLQTAMEGLPPEADIEGEIDMDESPAL